MEMQVLPWKKKEMQTLEKNFNTIQPYLTPEGLEEINKNGKFLYDREFGWVTPTINGAICAYGFRDKQGIIKCGIEAAYNDGKLDWKKPISCHLYPIRTTEYPEFDVLHYDRWHICSSACSFGRELKVPVFRFLKEPLIRKYGEEWYNELEEANTAYKAGV